MRDRCKGGKPKRPRPRAESWGTGGGPKGTAPARHVLSGSQWPPLSPPRGRGGAPSWRHQDNGRCRRRVTLGCGRACGSSAMVSLGPSQPGRLALPRPGWVAGRPPSGLGRAAPGSQRGRAAACGAPGQGRTGRTRGRGTRWRAGAPARCPGPRSHL